jgi:hypothetical protein
VAKEGGKNRVETATAKKKAHTPLAGAPAGA